MKFPTSMKLRGRVPSVPPRFLRPCGVGWPLPTIRPPPPPSSKIVATPWPDTTVLYGVLISNRHIYYYNYIITMLMFIIQH